MNTVEMGAGINTDNAEAQRAFDKIDTDGDGKISGQDITEFVKKEEKAEKSSKKNKKCAITWSIIAFILLILLAVAVVWYMVLGKKSNIYSKQLAAQDFYDISTVAFENLTDHNTNITDILSTINITDVYEFSDAELKQLAKAFDAFDDNNDHKWNFNEYVTYLEMEEATPDTIFEAVDIDNDGVMSYREVIVVFRALSTISSIRTVFAFTLAPFIDDVFDVHMYNVSGPIPPGMKISDEWFEYAAALYIAEYDPGYKGFVTLSDYVTYQSQASFNNIDEDGDGLIQFDEFIERSYNLDAMVLFSLAGITGTNSTLNNMNIKSQLTLENVIDQELSSCPQIYLSTSNYNYTELYTRRLVSKGACIGASTSAGLIIAGTAACCFFTAGVGCGACAVLGVKIAAPALVSSTVLAAGAIGTCIGYAVDSGGCIDSRSTIFRLSAFNTIDKVMANDINLGDRVLTKNGFEEVFHRAHFIHEDSNNSVTLSRKLCYKEDCITISYHHMLFVNDSKILKPAANVNIGDIIFVTLNDSQFKMAERDILHIEENVTTHFRMLFTDSGTIVANGVLISSYTGKNNFDASLQHNILTGVNKVFSFFNNPIKNNDEYKMVKLRNMVYYGVVKPIKECIKFT